MGQLTYCDYMNSMQPFNQPGVLETILQNLIWFFSMAAYSHINKTNKQTNKKATKTIALISLVRQPLQTNVTALSFVGFEISGGLVVMDRQRPLNQVCGGGQRSVIIGRGSPFTPMPLHRWPLRTLLGSVLQRRWNYTLDVSPKTKTLVPTLRPVITFCCHSLPPSSFPVPRCHFLPHLKWTQYRWWWATLASCTLGLTDW